MNAVEIEQAVSDLVEAPFDRESFAFSFLEAFGNKSTTIKKLKVDRSKKASTNHSDLDSGVLQRNNIHLLVCDEGQVTESLKTLVKSPETAKRKAKYALATDGKTIEAENLVEGETLVCEFAELADHFGFFLPLAGITTVKEIRNNAFDIKATSRLNRLYVELLRHNPDWDTAKRREEMNHFFARLIFCFFAEDTGSFNGSNLFTKTIEQMSDGTNAHEILTELFRAMNTSTEERKRRSGLRQKSRIDGKSLIRNSGESHYIPLPNYAIQFPYVNGGLFSGSPEASKFTKIARSYLIHVGHLGWTQINSDIFSSMIQAVADSKTTQSGSKNSLRDVHQNAIERFRMNERPNPPSVTVNYPQTGASTRSNEMGMRAMQERAYQKRTNIVGFARSPELKDFKKTKDFWRNPRREKRMPNRNHLRRLDPAAYQGTAVVHWTMTIRDRKTGWLDARFYYHFRELLTHSLFYQMIACPIFCLMPDHIHMIWLGILESSDQKLAMRHLRKRLNLSLAKIGFELQDQPYDHVLTEDERQEEAFLEVCKYIAQNPERGGLVGPDEYQNYPYSSCLVPGYPELNPFANGFWIRFDRTVSHLRRSSEIRQNSEDTIED